MAQGEAFVAERGTSASEGEKQSRLVTGLPIYYGWVILAAATIGRIMTSPGQTYTISIFIDYFIEDLGVSRSLVSTLYTIGTLTGALSLPFIGRKLDRHGPRVITGIVTVLFSLACVYMGFIQGAIMLGLGFILLRMLGQGSLSMIATNVVNRWWVRRRGTVLGIAGVVSSVLGSGLFPTLVLGLINGVGWRTSYPILGAMVAVVMLPIGLLLYRRQPEDYGLLPDGARVPPGGTARDAAPIEENWTRAEALRTTAFWVTGLSLASISMLGTGLQFHMVSIFQDSGLSQATAAAAFLPVAITIAVVSLVSGILIDRVPVRFLLFAMLLGQASTLVMAPRLSNVTVALAYGIVMGTTNGLQRTVSLTIWPIYFGRKHLGAITGMASLISIGGSALGPMPMGIARDLLGSYNLVLPIAAVLPLALGLVALFTGRPHRDDDASAAPA